MKNLSTLFCLSLMFLACQSEVANQQNEQTALEENTPDDSEFLFVPGKRIGKISVEKSSPEDVLQAYGTNAVEDTIYLGEGVEAKGVVLFPDQPDKRVDFYWDSEVDSLRPSFIRITGDENGHSVWHTDMGIKIGTPIEEVEALNGRPFLLYGFDWDYGGVVNSWDGGNLPETLGLTFSYTVSEVPEYLLGEVILKSNDEKVLAVKPVVSTMVGSFRE